MKVVYSRAAASDLEHIHHYLAERTTPEFAEQMTERIMQTFQRLVKRNPRAGKLRNDLDPNARSLPVLPYFVFYGVEERRVIVRRILHGRRNLKAPLASLLQAI